MWYLDHSPPHFHAIYGAKEIKIRIDGQTVELFEGEAPNRVISLVLEWAHQHHSELLKNWGRCQEGEIPLKIKALE